MTLSLTLAFLSVASAPACTPVEPGRAAVLPTEQAAISAAKVVWGDKFNPATVKEREPYRAELAEGTWHVFGTLPEGWRGGTPEALICASNGKVLKVFHGR